MKLIWILNANKNLIFFMLLELKCLFHFDGKLKRKDFTQKFSVKYLYIICIHFIIYT